MQNFYLVETQEGLFIKQIKQANNIYYMCSKNPDYQDIELEEFKILGKVTGALNRF